MQEPSFNMLHYWKLGYQAGSQYTALLLIGIPTQQTCSPLWRAKYANESLWEKYKVIGF